jgi:hypothetical protein
MREAGTFGLVVAIPLLIFALFLMVTGKRTHMVTLYLICLMFSGFYVESVNAGSVLLRWVLLGMIALTTWRGLRWPGAPAMLLGGLALYAVIVAPLTPVTTTFAIQRAGLLFVSTMIMGAALSHEMGSIESMRRLLKTFLVAAGLYAILGLSSIGSITATGGGRFSGATESAPLFVLTGGLLLPFCLWGAMEAGNKWWRGYSLALTIVIGLLCIVSGQRTGAVAGFFGCLPLLARIRPGKLVASLGIVFVGIAVVAIVLMFMPDQAEYLYERYIGRLGTGAYTTGRWERWMATLDRCYHKPFIGHGAEANLILPFGPHNVYLTTWYDYGLMGLLLFSGGLLTMIIMTVRTMRNYRHTAYGDIARLLFGVTLALVFAGLFESKLTSPSNVSIFALITVSVLGSRLGPLAAEADEQRWDGAEYVDSPHALPVR